MKLTIFTILTLLIFSTTPILAQNVDFEDLNPAKNFTNSQTLIGDLLGGTTGSKVGVISLAIIFGGLLLFIMLLSGGFTMLTNPTNPQAQELGKNRITFAVIGFLILFSTFWIIQIIQIIFNINILGGTTSFSSTPTSSSTPTVTKTTVCFGNLCKNNPNDGLCTCTGSTTPLSCSNPSLTEFCCNFQLQSTSCN